MGIRANSYHLKMCLSSDIHPRSEIFAYNNNVAMAGAQGARTLKSTWDVNYRFIRDLER